MNSSNLSNFSLPGLSTYFHWFPRPWNNPGYHPNCLYFSVDYKFHENMNWVISSQLNPRMPCICWVNTVDYVTAWTSMFSMPFDSHSLSSESMPWKTRWFSKGSRKTLISHQPRISWQFRNQGAEKKNAENNINFWTLLKSEWKCPTLEAIKGFASLLGAAPTYIPKGM